MTSHRRARAVSTATLAASLLAAAAIALTLAGCLETDVPIAPVEQAKVNKAYVGDWQFTDDNGKVTVYRVRNFNDREYYVEVEEPDGAPADAAAAAAGERTVGRFAAFVIPVEGADFAHTREMRDDGELSSRYAIQRVALKDGRLELRQLSESFFKQHDVTTSEKLRRVIEQNLDNAAMYDGSPVLGARLGGL